MKAFDVAISVPWAMQEDRLDELLTIAERRNEVSDKALEQFRSAALNNAEQATIRDGIAILTVQGPLFKRANLFTAISGATSYDVMMRDLQTALDNPSVQSIMLSVDSPGGEASGADEFAEAVFQARKKKPVYAYISGTGASAAYWIASSAEKIFVSELANIGSIGVVAGMKVTQEREGDRTKTYEFVSSQSPHKRADMESDEGKAVMQARVDDMASVFIGAVARNRGVTAEDVMQNFGRGGVHIGAKAVAAGMADEVGLFEAAMADLKKRGSRRATGQNGATRMTDEPNGGTTAADTDKIRADAEASATKRAADRMDAILNDDNASKAPDTARFIATKTAIDAATASGLLAVAAGEIDGAKASADETINTPAAYEGRKGQALELGAMGAGAGASAENPMLAAVKRHNETVK